MRSIIARLEALEKKMGREKQPSVDMILHDRNNKYTLKDLAKAAAREKIPFDLDLIQELLYWREQMGLENETA